MVNPMPASKIITDTDTNIVMHILVRGLLKLDQKYKKNILIYRNL